jgi:hypothetical protein
LGVWGGIFFGQGAELARPLEFISLQEQVEEIEQKAARA